MPTLRNTRTGRDWAVTPQMYERLIKKDRFVDPTASDASKSDAPEEDAPEEDASEGSPEPEEEAHYSVGEHKGGGYYYLLRGDERVVEGGEPVTVGRGPEAAQKEVDALNGALSKEA